MVKVFHILDRFTKDGKWYAKLLLDCGHTVERRLPNGKAKDRAICGFCQQ